MGDEGDESSSATLLIVIGGVFVLLGLGTAVSGTASAFNGMQAADAGVEVEGTVIETSIQEEWEEDGTDESGKQDHERVYHAQITYNYTVEGETYTSSNYKAPALVTEPVGKEFDSHQDAVAFLDGYNTGSSLTVYYLPDDHAKSFLEKPEYSPVELALPVAFGFPFLVVGAGIILYARGTIGSSWRSENEQSEVSADQASEEWGSTERWGTNQGTTTDADDYEAQWGDTDEDNS